MSENTQIPLLQHPPLLVSGITLKKIKMELSIPFETSFGREEEITKIFPILELKSESGVKVTGIGECPTNVAPWLDGTTDETDSIILSNHIIPSLLKNKQYFTNVVAFRQPFSWIVGNNIAKFGIEAAYWDAVGKLLKQPVYTLWGGQHTKIETGTSVGLEETDEKILEKVDLAVDQKVKRIKIKIKPGRDVTLIKKIRDKYPDILLQVDGNAAYDLDNKKHIALLKELDQFNLLMIEQPGPHDDRYYHAKLSKLIETPICLDESILHLRHAREAIDLWKKESSKEKLIINIKPARVGGFWEAINIADLCKQEKIKAWCGGMVESALGKIANLHFNSVIDDPLPGDHISQKPYYKKDIITPVLAIDGELRIPEGNGWGISPFL